MIVLHIGTDETGSTAIQKLISINRQVFEKKGWLYPKKIGENGHRQWKLYDKLKKNEFDILEELKKEVEESGLSNVLLSYEEYYKLEEEQIAKLLALLGSLNKGEVKILIYLRRQDDMQESSILQSMKTGKRKELELSDIALNPAFDYYSIIKKWEKFIKKENIIIRPYGKEFLPNTYSLYEDFFYHSMGIDYNEIKEDLITSDKDPNPSLDAVSAHIIDFFANFLQEDYKDIAITQLLAVQNKLGVTKSYLFDKSERNNILSLYKKGNKLLIDEYGIPESLFALEMKEYSKPAEKEIAKRFSCFYERKKYLLPLTNWNGKDGFISNIDNHKIVLWEGFHKPENWGVWTKGDEISKMAFWVSRDYYYANRYLDIKVSSRYIPDSNTLSFIRIGENDWMQLKGEDKYRVSTKEIRKDGGVVFVEFRHENAVSPSIFIKESKDTRVIGCGIKALELEEII